MVAEKLVKELTNFELNKEFLKSMIKNEYVK